MVCMALYADNCVATMSAQVQSLEVDLGPDTADLGIRIGLHSGPVTAGVLRGGKYWVFLNQFNSIFLYSHFS